MRASGDDGSAELVRERFPDVVDLVHSRARLLVGGARNLGVAASHGEVVAFLGADCVAEPGVDAGACRRASCRPRGSRVRLRRSRHNDPLRGGSISTCTATASSGDLLAPSWLRIPRRTACRSSGRCSSRSAVRRLARAQRGHGRRPAARRPRDTHLVRTGDRHRQRRSPGHGGHVARRPSTQRVQRGGCAPWARAGVPTHRPTRLRADVVAGRPATRRVVVALRQPAGAHPPGGVVPLAPCGPAAALTGWYSGRRNAPK